MKRNLLASFFFILCSLVPFSRLLSQCPAGYTQSQLNWDNLDYLISTGSYSGFVTAARASTQHFAIGPNRVIIAAATPSFTLNGENATHTGELANYTGQDVQYAPVNNGDSVVITFESGVLNPSFALYDIDNSANYTVTARDAAGAALGVTVTLQASTILTVGGLPAARTITSNTTLLANTSNQGSAIISIAGATPIKTIRIQVTARGGNPEFWLSDINACVTGSFVNNYRVYSRPFTGMPPYILSVVNSDFYTLDPRNGRLRPLFTDPNHNRVNGMAYDPYNRVLYYTFSLTSDPVNNKTVYKYDFATETVGEILINDVTASLGIPTYDQGVESGSASFHGGHLYFGVESANSARTSGRENTVWRIEFDATQNPTRASQVYATRSDSNVSGSNRLIHDWSDIGIVNDGMLYDFDGAANSTMYYHFNMMTGQRVQYTPGGTGNIDPKQLAIDWQENVYSVGGVAAIDQGYIVPYNYNGTVNAAQQYSLFSLPGPTYPVGSWGDCSEAYRPYCDFGDAPNSYEMPDSIWAPAVHERDTALKIGPSFDREWLKMTPMDATGDGADEDGLAFVPVLAPGTGSYAAQTSVYNNTGSPAVLIAWLDYNGNGYFDPAEAITPISVPSSTSLQNFWLYWPSTPNPFVNGQYTYLRIRLVRSGMTISDPAGYYDNGETEDYRVVVDDFPLTVNLLSFDAKAVNNSRVRLNWTTSGEENFAGFETERSANNIDWQMTGSRTFAKGNGRGTINGYERADEQPLPGKSYYRLKLLNNDGSYKYSEIKTVVIKKGMNEVTVFPNPAMDKAMVTINSSGTGTATISIVDMSGRTMQTQRAQLNRGSNVIEVSLSKKFSNGMYMIMINAGGETNTQKLFIKKK